MQRHLPGRLLLLLLSCSLALAVPGAAAQPPTTVPSSAADQASSSAYEKTVRSLFSNAHTIEVYVRYINRRKKPAVAEIERVLRDRQTFVHIQDILLAHAAEAQPVVRGPGRSAGSVHLIFEFKDAKGEDAGNLLIEDGKLLIFDPGDDFEVDREMHREMLRLFIHNGDRLK